MKGMRIDDWPAAFKLQSVERCNLSLWSNVRFTPESGPFSALAFMSAYDPKRTFIGLCDEARGHGNPEVSVCLFLRLSSTNGAIFAIIQLVGFEALRRRLLFWRTAAPNQKEAKMPYTQADHPMMWEVSHHPIIALVLALGFGVLVAWLVLGGLIPGPAALTDFNFAA